MRKYIKYLILPIILIISIICVSCNNSDDSDEIEEYAYTQEINAKYLSVSYSKNEDVKIKQIINSKTELDDYIEAFNIKGYNIDYFQTNIDGYNDEFFYDKSLIAFIITESSGLTTSVIKSYNFMENILTINIETIDAGDLAVFEYYLYTLELSKDITNNTEDIVINKKNYYKNNEDDFDIEIPENAYGQIIDFKFVIPYYSSLFKSNTPKTIINSRKELDDYLLNCGNVYDKEIKLYEKYDEEYFNNYSLIIYGLLVNNIAVIKSYAIGSNTIKINMVDVTIFSSYSNFYYYMLRVDKSLTEDITNIVITNNGEVIE